MNDLDDLTSCIFNPAFAQNNIPVVMASSEQYVPFLSVLLQSILDNSSNTNNYDIIVLSNQISQANQQILFDWLSVHNNFSIRFIPIDSLTLNKNLYTRMHITPITYARLCVYELLPHYDKVVYLDCDIVVNVDIATLYNTDISGHLIAAARDSVMASWCNIIGNKSIAYNRDILKLDNVFDYFNAGVIVLNLHLFRNTFQAGQLLEIALSKQWEWFDQDVLNMVCHKKVLFLDNSWNVMAHLSTSHNKLVENYAPDVIKNAYFTAKANPYIIHYAGNFLPCFEPRVDLSDFFWKYAQASPMFAYIQTMEQKHKQSILKIYLKNFADILFPKHSKRRSFVKNFFNLKKQ